MHRRAAAILLALLTCLGLTASPAAAGTGGTPDGDEHQNVAFLVYYWGGDRHSCSGTLVTPTVVLTAAHCTEGVESTFLVTFDPEIAEEQPLPYAAADPEVGFTPEEVEAHEAHAGAGDTHPDYSGFTDERSWNDLGVVVLEDPIDDIAPARLADLGTLDAIRKSDLSRTMFTAVGYGMEMRTPETGPRKAQAHPYPLLRRQVEMPGQKVTAQLLQTQANVDTRKGTGATCHGDSGGPVLLDGEVVGVTSYGINDKCTGVSGFQRVDIAAAREWLATVLG
jgi:hypothetical protein